MRKANQKTFCLQRVERFELCQKGFNEKLPTKSLDRVVILRKKEIELACGISLGSVVLLLASGSPIEKISEEARHGARPKNRCLEGEMGSEQEPTSLKTFIVRSI